METRLHNLLHDIATEMPIEVEASVRPTLRRARRRRVMTSVGAGVVVVALVAVSVSALRLADEPAVTPAVTGPNPSATFEGLWPETDAEALAVTQVSIGDGHEAMRTTPEGTATLLATNLLGWQLDDVQAEPIAVDGDEATAVISNRNFGDPVPPITVDLRQLGDTGSNGAWSIVGVSTPLIELDKVTKPRPGVISVFGNVDLTDRVPASLIRARVFDGPTLEPSLGSAEYSLTDGSVHDLEVTVEPTPDGEATLLLTLPDAVGASLGAVMRSVETPVGATSSEPSVDVEGVAPDVAATAQRIYDAARARDFDALAALLDPNTFVYNLDDGSDPIPAWRADPSELDLMVAILEMPPTTRDIEGVGTFTFWPYLVNSDFSALGEQERADLVALGFTDEEIRLMIDGARGYQGPRLAIDERGNWRNFITVGE